jgi:predicted dithiol-disulfide oxidoreductase (DUF899 family)
MPSAKGLVSLVGYHLVFEADWDAACPSCSMWVDGVHGVAHHLTRRVDFAVIAMAPLVRVRAWARRRGRDGLRILSSDGTGFSADCGVVTSAGDPWPALSVFARRDGGIRHTYLTPFVDHGIDLLTPVWHVLDLVPEGRGDWEPDNSYPGRSRTAGRPDQGSGKG